MLFGRKLSSLALHPTDLPSARRCWVRPARIPLPFMFSLTFLLTPPWSFINCQLCLQPGKLSLLPLPLITAPNLGASHKPSLSFLPFRVMNVFPQNCQAPTLSFLQGSAVSTSGAGPALGFSQSCCWLRLTRKNRWRKPLFSLRLNSMPHRTVMSEDKNRQRRICAQRWKRPVLRRAGWLL